MMSLTVRLDAETERILNALAKRRQQSRSDVVREAIAAYGASQGDRGGAQPAYEAWQDVIGVVSLGARDRARSTGEQFTTLARRKHARHAR